MHLLYCAEVSEHGKVRKTQPHRSRSSSSRLTSLQALSPFWQLGLQSPFCHFHFNYSRLCDRRPPQHCAFPGVPWKTNLFARRQCVRSVYKVIKQSNASLPLPVWVLPYLPGLAVSNERGVWAKLFGCVISFIMPFIGGPRVINKQRSGWLRGVTDGQIVNRSCLGLRGGGYATDDRRGCTVPWCNCCRHLSCWRCNGWGEENGEEKEEEEERKRWMAELSRGYVGCWTLWW